MIGQADLLHAIDEAWDARGLPAAFLALRPAGTAAAPTLFDKAATPGSPFPYCVIEVGHPRTITRMTGDATTKNEIRETSLSFSIQAEKIEGDVRSSRKIAYDLMELVAKAFGGHPAVQAEALVLENGGHLLTQYVTDYPEETERYKCRWVLEYRLLTDVPVAMMST